MALLVRSPLFDDAWYARRTGVQRTRAAAARNFLKRRGDDSRPSAHPLFDPDYYVQQLDEQQLAALGDTDPFLFYLRRRTFRRATHPLFDTRGYLRRNEGARGFRGGPLAHYDQVGAPEGLQSNDWLEPDAAGRHPDLRAWLDDRYDAWQRARDEVPTGWRPRHDTDRERAFLAGLDGVHPPVPADRPLVSVVLDAGLDEPLLRHSLVGLAAQTLTSWELVVVDRGGIPDLTEALAEALPEAPAGARVETVRCDDDSLAEGLNAALAAARGEHVAFLGSGDVWQPDRLRVLSAVAARDEADAVADVLASETPDGAPRFAAGGHPSSGLATRGGIDLARLLLRRSVLDRLGGFDTSLRGAWRFDLVLRLSRRHDVALAPVVGVQRRPDATTVAHRLPPSRRPALEHAALPSWADVALNLRLVDWDELAGRDQRAGTVSVVIPTYNDWQLTAAAVESVLASDGEGGIRVECIVWDNGSAAPVATVLDSFPARFPGVRLARSSVNHGFGLGNNLALPLASGGTVVFLNNDTTVEPGWLRPVLDQLEDEAVLGVQSLLVYPGGAVQSAGVAFPSTGGLPYAFLQNFPLEDAAGIEDLDFAALTGAALAVRYADVVAVRGFDPLFTNGMEDVDLCRRLAALRPGTFRVASTSPVVHHESRTEGRYDRFLMNRRIYLDRWEGVDEPRDDARLWATRGFRVVDHEVRRTGEWQERRLLLPEPVLARESRLQVRESPPRLRWAIKNPAPGGRPGDRWGDSHFAAAIGAALRDLGHDVVVDRRPEFERRTSRHDDVALVLRGVAPFRPTPEQVSIGWVISHPEMLPRAEAAGYDRLLAASVQWAAVSSRAWGIRVEPLLQATDPALFHPDTAVPDTGHPVLFVGSSRAVYRAIVRDAVEAGLPLSVYGDAWERFIPKRHIKQQYLPNGELSAAYRSAGVVLNDHWEDMRAQGFLSNRLFDAVGSGARVVSDDVAGLRDVFGDSVQVYRTPADLVRLTSLADPDPVYGDDAARREAAATVHREHSFAARARRLVEIALEARRERGFDT